MSPSRHRGLRGVVAAFAVTVAGVGCELTAPAFAQSLGAGPAGRSEDDARTSTLLGSYLAGRAARAQHDTAAAAAFYREAMRLDPDSGTVLESSFLVETAEGNFDRATELANKVVALQANHRLGQMWLATRAMKERKFKEAEERIAKATGGGPIGELTTTLARAWIKIAAGESSAASDLLRNSRIADAAQTYIRYHRALISDLSGRRAEAAREYEAVFKQDPRTPRLALAYAQHAASGGDLKLARAILKEHLDKIAGEGQPMIRALQSQLNGNEVIPLLVESPEQGYAEVFYGLGEALSGEGGVALGAGAAEATAVVATARGVGAEGGG